MPPARRLLFVTGTPASVREGSGTYIGISVLGRALERMGHEVRVVAPRRALGAWRRLWFNLRLRHHGASAPGATVVGFDLDGLFLPGRTVAAVKGVLAEERQFERGWPRLSLTLQAQWERWRVRRARRVLATSRYAAGAIERHYGVPRARIRVVPELLDVAEWQALLAAAPMRPADIPVILCVAHLYPRKDIATLLRAVAQLRVAARVHIVGVGPEQRRLQRLASQLELGDRVTFLGHINRAALAAEYRNATLFCLPSRQEGFGIVLLEAMAAGLPVVAARAAAIPEVVPEPLCGCLFEPGNDADLARTLDALLDDPTVRRDQSAAARRRAAEFDAPLVAAQFLQALT